MTEFNDLEILTLSWQRWPFGSGSIKDNVASLLLELQKRLRKKKVEELKTKETNLQKRRVKYGSGDQLS